MELFTLFGREIKDPPYRLLAYSVISGISNAFLISVINSATETVASNTMNWKYFIMYLLAMFIFAYTKRYILDRCSELVELVVSRIRYRLIDQIRQIEFAAFERYGTSVMHSRLSQDAIVISSLSPTLISGFQHALMIACTLLYIATVSVLSAGLMATGIIIGIIYYLSHSESFETRLKSVSKTETEFLVKLGHILQGFKEININRRKNENAFNDYIKVNSTIRAQRTKTSQLYNAILIFAQVFIYLLLCTILFGLSKFQPQYANATIKVIASVLFIMGPLESLLYCIPLYAQATTSASNIIELEELLEEELKKTSESQMDPNSPAAYEVLPFHSHIDIKGLGFQYTKKDGRGFQVGPIDLTIQQGEVIFVTGGNGSGKSTFLKLLTGLYQPSMGSILLDEKGKGSGSHVSQYNRQQYQNLFATIFSDYHLFDKLNGSEKQPDPVDVKALLKKMELSETVTNYADGGFSDLHLSSGQKKRLALIAAVLEDKSIYVFDEVAADLDPEFRNKFYHEILSDLKSRHKTLLVVSHDQQYWSTADRLLNFRNGAMQKIAKGEIEALIAMEFEKYQKE